MSLCRMKSLVRPMMISSWSSLYFCVGNELSNVVKKKYGYIDYEYGIKSASTDFVSVLVMLVPQNLYTDISEGEYFAS